jgi:ankyrin repeat protein
MPNNVMHEYETLESVLDAVWQSSVEFGNYGQRPNVNSRGTFGNTPLIPAITWGNEGAVSLLLQAGADPDIQGERGNSALHHAVQMGEFKIVKLLVSHGANQNIANEEGKLPRDLCWHEEWPSLFGARRDA